MCFCDSLGYIVCLRHFSGVHFRKKNWKFRTQLGKLSSKQTYNKLNPSHDLPVGGIIITTAKTWILSPFCINCKSFCSRLVVWLWTFLPSQAVPKLVQDTHTLPTHSTHLLSHIIHQRAHSTYPRPFTPHYRHHPVHSTRTPANTPFSSVTHRNSE